MALLLLSAGCSADRPDQVAYEQPAESAEEVQISSDTFAIGSSVTPEGGVPREAVNQNFIRGHAVYLAVDVKSASTAQTIAVDWFGPDGKSVRHDEQRVPQARKYATFSTGPTGKWNAGEYHAIVTIDGRRVTERAFSLMS